MTSKNKLHERIRNNPNGVRFDDIAPWLRFFNFTLERISGSHHVFRHKSTGIKLNFQPDKSGMAKAYQVKQAIKAIEGLP